MGTWNPGPGATAANDVFTGNGANETASGLGGADSIDGGTGDDTLSGGGGNDVLLGENVLLLSDLPSSGNDTINGGGGNDLIFGGAGADILNGGNGDDALHQQGGRGGAFGNTAVQITVWDWGADVMDGGDGIDIAHWDFTNQTAALSFSLAAPNVVSTFLLGGVFAGSVTRIEAISVKGGSGNDVMHGGAMADAFDGGQGSDTLYGEGGNDFLSSGVDGADILVGGSGDDTYFIQGALIPTITESSDQGDDTIRISSSAYSTYSLADFSNVETFWYEGSNAVTLNAAVWDSTLLAGAGDDTLTGDVGDDFLGGGAGGDVMSGGAGDDFIDGGIGNDTMSGGDGDDGYVVEDASDIITEAVDEGSDSVQISGAIVSYSLSENIESVLITSSSLATFVANDQDNTISISGGDIDRSVQGRGGNDDIRAADGDDTIDGGAGADTMAGGAGNDVYVVDNAGDIVSEDALSGGIDTVRASVSYKVGAFVENLTLTGATSINAFGNSLDNVLRGNTGANLLDGRAGADTLAGGAGVDVLSGGAGHDVLSGGAAADVFLFNFTPAAAHSDVITDFKPGGDKIHLENAVMAGLGVTTGTMGPGKFWTGAAAHDANDRIIYNPANGELLYDADGHGAGAAVLLATLQTGLTLTNADFVII